MLTLTDVKNYLRATDEDDALVQSLMLAANGYLEGAVDNFASVYDNADENWKAKADLCMKLLCCDWYENRTPVGRPGSSAVELLITQLQLTEVNANETDTSS